ncbi:MAG: NADH-quinone oxidoreductase subunit N [Pedosphaera sp.]|nr:NADH-quinone oxidoreductase subunit N [Pedosphaera sp.]
MNVSLIEFEITVVLLGMGVLLLDLWTPAERKPGLGLAAALSLLLVLVATFLVPIPQGAAASGFGGGYLLDGLALFFKRFFLVAAILVLVMQTEFADRIASGISEFYALVLFALAGMMFAASANNFVMLFVAIELITVTFYVLTSFQRGRTASLEAGVKYLILGALSSGFLVFGIALIYGTSGTMSFPEIAAKIKASHDLAHGALFQLGVLLVLVALGFKIAAVPMQIWAPDVYQGAPAPVTAFLAVGSKAAGMVLLLRVLLTAVPDLASHSAKLLMTVAGITILYGSLCAIPQRNLKRLLGYSSIASAGFLLLGISALSLNGISAILYYLGGYLFTVLAAFLVICIVTRNTKDEDISVLAGLHQRSPLLAAGLTLAMVSLAGVPPLAGFFGKFLLLKAAVESASNPEFRSAYYTLVAVGIVGVIISLYYYFGVMKAIFWTKPTGDLSPIPLSLPARLALYVCIAGMLFLGLYPGPLLDFTDGVVKAVFN